MAFHDGLNFSHCDVAAAQSSDNVTADDLAVERVEQVLYGVLMPVLSGLGIVGNILNLVVLTRPNLMKIITYTYFRAMACSDLLSMLLAIPFALEATGHRFTSYVGAFFQV